MRAEDSEKTIYGFGIKARVDLEANEWLFELAGLVSTNGCEDHTWLSVIQHSNHHQSRLLGGPVRFINHICSTPNAQVRMCVAWLSVFTD
jgi:hypothetical protein